MNKRPEVIKYMRKIGFDISLRYVGINILLIALFCILYGWDLLLIALPLTILLLIMIHFIVRWHIEKTMYTFYCDIYDTEQYCLKKITELEVKNES